jgi:cobalamin biosynthesis protein CobT
MSGTRSSGRLKARRGEEQQSEEGQATLDDIQIAHRQTYDDHDEIVASDENDGDEEDEGDEGDVTPGDVVVPSELQEDVGVSTGAWTMYTNTDDILCAPINFGLTMSSMTMQVSFPW